MKRKYMLNWCCKTFLELTTNELYDLLKLRVDVFVVEQQCYYPDLDDLDRDAETRHIFAYDDAKSDAGMLAYCRVIRPNLVYPKEFAIGRVVVVEALRRQSIGYKLMEKALIIADDLWPDKNCRISAQQHLVGFYENLGFKQITEVYLEDGIPHVGMIAIKKAN